MKMEDYRSNEKNSNRLKRLIYKNIMTIYELLSADNLLETFIDQEFFTLGFLVALIEEAEDNYDKSSDSDLIPDTKKSWMEFYSQRECERSEFYFSAISIRDALKKKDLFKKYFLFMDEFSGIPWAVLIRNLIRANGMRVLVEYIDSNIANFTGLSDKTYFSKRPLSEIREVWSIVVIRLNRIYLNASDPKYISLLEKIEDIIESFKDKEKEAVRLFFKDFINDQFFKLRPGILELVREIILKLSIDKAQSANYIFDTIITNLGIELAAQKSRIHYTPQGLLGNLGLFLSNSYDKKRSSYLTRRSIIDIESRNPDEKKELIFHKRSYLMNHLYHFENPVVKRMEFKFIIPVQLKVKDSI
jgi:hypothetical protein